MVDYLNVGWTKVIRAAPHCGGAGLARESLYRSLSASGNPEFGTVLKVMRALGLRLQAAGAVSANGE